MLSLVVGSRRRAVGMLSALVLGAALAAPAAAEDPAWVATYPVQTGSQNRISALPDGTVWAVVDGRRLLRSTDAGRTWNPLNPLPVHVPGLPMTGPDLGGSSDTIVAPSSSTKAYGANGQALSRTVDAGLTWSSLKPPSVTRSRFFEYALAMEHTGGRLHYARSGSEVVDGCPYPLRTTPMLSSPDGVRWTRSDIAVPGGWVQEIRFADARRGAALVVEFEYTETERDGSSCGYSGVGATTSVQVTSDGGRTWRHVHRCRPNCFALSWSTPRRLMVGQVDGVVLRSADAGRRFTPLSELPLLAGSPITFLQALDCVRDRCWASVNGGGIFRTDADAEWSREVSGQEVFGLQIGDLSAIDAERAVSGGPHALMTRVDATGGPAPGRPVHAPRTLPLPGGAVLHPDGSLTVRVSLPR